MAKNAVYSWRLDSDLKMNLDTQARVQGKTLAEVLNTLAKRWLEEQKEQNAELEAEQARLRSIAAKFVGCISGGDPYASEKVREVVGKRVRERNAH
jgi:hypothetical protein